MELWELQFLLLLLKLLLPMPLIVFTQKQEEFLLNKQKLYYLWVCGEIKSLDN